MAKATTNNICHQETSGWKVKAIIKPVMKAAESKKAGSCRVLVKIKSIKTAKLTAKDKTMMLLILG